MITADDLRGLTGLRRRAVAALLSKQPTTVLQALRIRDIGRKTTKALLARGLLADPEGLQHRAMTTKEFGAAPWKEGPVP